MSEGADYQEPNPKYRCSNCGKVFANQKEIDQCRAIHAGYREELALILHKTFCSVEVCKLNYSGVKVCTGKEGLWLERAEKLLRFGRKFNLPVNELKSLFSNF